MNDQTIDSLMLEIEADSSGAERSLDRLSRALSNLNTQLRGLDSVTRLTNSLTRLSKVNFDSSKSGLFDFIKQMRKFATADFSGFDSKINNFVNSLGRLANTDLRKYSSRLNSFVVDMRRLTETDMSGFNSEITSFVRAMSKLLSVTNNGADTQKLNEVSNAVTNLVQNVSNIQVSDNLANLVSGLGQIASKSSSVEKEMKSVNKQYTSFQVNGETIMNAVKGIASAFGDLLSILKKVSSIGVNAFRGVINAVKQFAQHKPKVDSLNISFMNLLKTFLGFRGVTGVFNWIKESISFGSEITEIDHIVESVFGTNMVKYVDEWAENAIDKFGIAANAAKKYAGTLTAMFQASNVGLKDSNKMALDLVGLAGDLSAFYNIDPETSYKKIQSGMAGMVRPLRDLGIDLTAATLKEYALSKGIEKSYSDMSQAEKVMLRYKYLMEQTTTQQGDFARTSGKLTAA